MGVGKDLLNKKKNTQKKIFRKLNTLELRNSYYGWNDRLFDFVTFASEKFSGKD